MERYGVVLGVGLLGLVIVVAVLLARKAAVSVDRKSVV